MPTVTSASSETGKAVLTSFKPRQGKPAGFGKREDRPETITGRPRLAPPIAPSAAVASDYSPSLLLRPALELSQVIDIHRRRASLHDYEPIGKLKLVVFGEPARGAPTPPRSETNVWGIRLDWMSDGPTLAVSSDGQDLLITSPIHHPPRIPHPAWAPKHGAYYEYVCEDGTRLQSFGDSEKQRGLVVKSHIWHPADKPDLKRDYIDQHYQDRSNIVWPGEAALSRGQGYIVFSPIAKVMFQNKRGFGYIKGLTDEANGSKFSLLINPNRRVRGEAMPEGFFVRGRFEIVQGPEV